MSEQARTIQSLENLGLSALLVAAGAARAAEIPVSPKAVQVPEAPPVEVKDGAVLLSVDDAVEIALQPQPRPRRPALHPGADRPAVRRTWASTTSISTARPRPTTGSRSTSRASRQCRRSSRTSTVASASCCPSAAPSSCGLNNSRSKSNNSNAVVQPGLQLRPELHLQPAPAAQLRRLSTEHDLLIAQNNSSQSRQEFERQVITTSSR